MDAKARLKEYIRYKGISLNSFTQTAGLSNGYLTKQGSVTSEHLAKIGEKFRDLNLEWVVNGKNYMVKTVHENKNFNTLNLREDNFLSNIKKLKNEHPELEDSLDWLEELIKAQNDTIRSLIINVESKDKMIEMYMQEIDKLKKEIDDNKSID